MTATASSDRPLTRQPAPPVTSSGTSVLGSKAFGYAAAATRISIGWIFLWAFLDKAFALGHDTGIDAKTGVVHTFGPAAWIHGGSPTLGFLKFGTAGPMAGFYHSFAGAGWADALFMLGLLGIGVTLMAGIAMRIATISAVAMLVMMWSAVLPPANNPFMDDHIVYALALLALLFAGAGHTLGLGRTWERLDTVQRHTFLK
jgi:thiosulfate dehydrogenase [quinone] large subunit